jgi:hypothetical protein
MAEGLNILYHRTYECSDFTTEKIEDQSRHR